MACRGPILNQISKRAASGSDDSGFRQLANRRQSYGGDDQNAHSKALMRQRPADGDTSFREDQQQSGDAKAGLDDDHGQQQQARPAAAWRAG